jgi:CBS domain-containing protein
VDLRIAALVGMAAIFAGASRAMLTSVVFAFETTRQPIGLLPLLGGCATAYLVSLLLMKHTIMTEKLARRGTRIDSEYSVDYLSQLLVRDIATPDIVVLRGEDAVEDVRDWMASRDPKSLHQGFPVVDDDDNLLGVVTRRNLLNLDLDIQCKVKELITRPPVVIYDTNTAREAADHMVREQVGRLPVVTRAAPRRVIGLVTRSDLLTAHARRLDDRDTLSRQIELGMPVMPWHFGKTGSAPRP